MLGTTPLLSSGIDVTARDMEIMRGLFESRVMSLAHVTALYFEGRAESAKKRVQKLKAAGIVGERPRDRYAPSILFVTRRGIDELRRAGQLSSYPAMSPAKLAKRMQVSPLTLRHELDCMDVKTALATAVHSMHGLSLLQFSTWPAIHQFPAYLPRGARVLVKPDGFLKLADGEAEYSYFLEVDRSTESQQVLAERAHCYTDYYRRGGYAMRNGGRKEAYAEYPFRVVMVFRNAERRNNAAERLLQNRPPILTQVILTTMPEFLKEPLAPIFIQPLDYRNATRGTPFDPSGRSAAEIYRRNPEREALIDRRVPKIGMM